MSPALINNTKRYLNRLGYETTPDDTPQPTPKTCKPTSKPFPDFALISIRRDHDNSPPSQRFSLASRTRLSLKRKPMPNLTACEVPWYLESGCGKEDGDRNKAVSGAVKEELLALIEALRNDVESGAKSCSICSENPELGYRINVRVQTKKNVKTVVWGKKEVLAVCVVVMGIGEGAVEKATVFGSGKATSVSWFGVSVRWAVDLTGDGRAERRGLVGRFLAFKRGLGKKEKVVGVYDEKMPLLK